MKKILHITKFFYPIKGGMENVVYSICKVYNSEKERQINVWCHEKKIKK